MSKTTGESGSRRLVRELERGGVQVVFGFPGETTLPLYASLRESPIRHVMARCERSAGYMADSYARVSGRVGVCDAPGGVGSPLLLSALHEAFNSSIPVVALTTGTSVIDDYRWTTGQCDHARMFDAVVKEQVSVRTSARIGELTQYALRTAASGRPGPVHLDIATDVLATAALPEARPSVPASGMFPTQRPRPGRRALVEVADLLRSAARPIVIAGGGTHLSGAGEVLTRFSEAFRVPVATTFNGKGIIAETTAFAVGVVGAKGHPAANALAGEADVVLWLGSKAGDKSTNYGRIPAAGAHVIQVDIDPHELGRILETDLQIAADATATLEDLHELLLSGGWRGAPRRWAAHAGSVLQTALTAGCGDQLHTLHLIAAIEERFSRKAVIVADASRACSWVGAFYRTGSAGRSVIAPRGSGSIGFALPATIGAAIARPECPVIGIGGDGGFGMSCHELETAVRLGTRFIFAILDNNSLGLLNQVSGVTLGQPDLCGDFAPTDWTAVAKAFGCRGETIDRPSQLPAALDAAVNSAKPTILDMKLPADEISPDFQMFTVRHTRSIPLVDEAVS